jgi:hypothetical protein
MSKILKQTQVTLHTTHCARRHKTIHTAVTVFDAVGAELADAGALIARCGGGICVVVLRVLMNCGMPLWSCLRSPFQCVPKFIPVCTLAFALLCSVEPLAGPAAALLRNVFHAVFLPGPHLHSVLRPPRVVAMPPFGVVPIVICSPYWGCAHHCGSLSRAPGGAGAAVFVLRPLFVVVVNSAILSYVMSLLSCCCLPVAPLT